jgi:hypothetical protein
MSDTYPSVAAHVPPEAIPKRPLTAAQALELLVAIGKNGKQLAGASRHGWLAWAVEQIADRYEAGSLGFLYCKPGESPEGYCAFLLRQEDIDRVIEELSLILDRANTEPEMFAEVLDGGCDGKAILGYLHSATVSLQPKKDDGSAPNYLFAYLKSLKWFCESAREAGCAILYMQWDGG